MGQLNFTLDLREPARRHVHVTLVIDFAEADQVDGLEFLLPAWTPGSYLIRDYCRHIGDFRVENAESGESLPWRKTAKNRYRVTPPTGCSRGALRYSVYAHELTVRTSDLTDSHAFISGATVFLWPVSDPGAKAVVRLQVPDSWGVATSLRAVRETPGGWRLEGAGLDEFVDSPILAGSFSTLSFTALDRPHSLVLDGLNGIEPPETLVRDTAAIVEHAAAVFGGPPPYEDYKFLCMFTDSGRGGLEHSASSALLAPRSTFAPEDSYREFMGLVAHEFFHVWNVKRMRPHELWEFDYERENHTELLWLAEGFTAYYDDHLCRRAGISTSRQYLEVLAKTISDLRQTPGRLRQSLSEASFDAWIRLYRPDENTRNSTLSYYGNGALAAVSLDLHIRAQTAGSKSLDDAMANLYQRTYLAGRGYTFTDVEEVLGEVAGQDMASRLHALVRQPLDPDFAALLAPFGLELEEAESQRAYLGIRVKTRSTDVASVLRDGPADIAGLMPGDELLAMDGHRVRSETWSKISRQVASVDSPLQVLVARRGRILTVTVRPTVQPATSLTIAKCSNPTPKQDELRRGWLFDPEY